MSERCHNHGLVPAFHHHIATPIETVAEIESLLEHTEIGLCLDTGHLLAVGGDPVGAVKAWGERIVQVHVKGVDSRIVDEVVAEGARSASLWERDAFCELPDAEATPAFLEALGATGYEGWVVVEQDTFRRGPTAFVTAVAAQSRSHAYLLEALSN